MTYVIFLVVVMVLIIILGVSIETVLQLLFLLLIAVSALLTLLFAVLMVMLILSHRISGKFVRCQKRENGIYDFAVYSCGDEEYSCIFPAERILRNHVYSDKPVKLYVVGRKKRIVFDSHSALIILCGMVLFPILLTYIVPLFFNIL